MAARTDVLKPAPVMKRTVKTAKPMPNTACTGRRGSTLVMLVHSTIMAIPAASQNRAKAQPPQ
jgi:hypothetical protein